MKRLDEIFDIRKPPSLELMNYQQVKKGVCFVSRTEKNNGIVARIERLDDLEPMPANAITVALGGSVLSSFYQDEPYYTSFHIACLYPKQNLTKEQMIYFACIIEQNKYRYNFGRQANKTINSILVPDVNQLPEFINNISISDYKFNKKSASGEKMKLDTSNWKYFSIFYLFDVYTSREKNAMNRTSGHVPFISSTQFSNGVAKYVDDEPTIPENTITIARNGSVGSAFYQPIPYCVSPDDIRILKPKFTLNKYIALFLTTIIETEKFRYGYGRKFGTKRMKETKIKLPVTAKGSPDWEFMEKYIKSLNYSGHI
jgi:hypothetical protein